MSAKVLQMDIGAELNLQKLTLSCAEVAAEVAPELAPEVASELAPEFASEVANRRSFVARLYSS